MTHRRFNPHGVAVPASRYSHAVLSAAPGRWLTLSGQLGLHPDGTVADGLAAQLDQAFANIDAALREATMTHSDLVKITVYLIDGSAESVATYRARRDVWIGAAPPPAATLLIVAGLASPAFLCEVEAVAAQ
ncbi:MAG TPA: RidA family protein [Paracoccaceae bacterium]|nr:RidA family protein [Paracoccaceae bacterium]HMO73192.1 RidA family protein [Paracoccaceae bacterium]